MKYDFNAAIFDMDGTLLNTMPYWRYTTLEFLLAHQLPVEEDVLLRMFNTSSRKLVMELLDRYAISIDRQTVIRELEGYMNRHYLFDANLKSASVPKVLKKLRSEGIRMCVATGAPREYAQNALIRLGIMEYFDFIYDNYVGSYTKEQPDYFREVLDRLNTNAVNCWVFEDALYAVKSAKAAGLRVCAIEEKAQTKDREEIMAMADIYIRDYSELL